MHQIGVVEVMNEINDPPYYEGKFLEIQVVKTKQSKIMLINV